METRPNTRESPETLDRYLNELSEFPLLNADGELALAREIEQLELAHWQALLSYRPAFDVAATAAQPLLPEAEPTLARVRKLGRTPRGGNAHAGKRDARREKAVAEVAEQLRAADLNGTALKAADAAVCRAFADDARARHYLARLMRARRAGQRAKASFVASNLRLVISMARRYKRSLLPLSDLIQEGNLGLMQAVERYDYRRGFRFSTYASWWIRHSLNRALSDKARVVRVPVHALDAAARVGKARDAIIAKTGVAPSLAELALQTGLSEDKLEQIRAEVRTRQPLSLDIGVGDENEQTLHDLLPAEPTDADHALDLASWRDKLPEIMSTLAPIEGAILRFRFGLGGGDELTLSEVGQKYNLSRERIRQLQHQALQKLRQRLANSDVAA